MQIEPPEGWSFEPKEVNLVVDGSTDKCSQGKDINFVFRGFAVIGKASTKLFLFIYQSHNGIVSNKDESVEKSHRLY